MKNLIVTSGEKFTDIDAYASAMAYNELLRLEGTISEVILPGALNNSVTPTIRRWGLPCKTKHLFKDFESILVDVSEPAQVAQCAPVDSVIEVYDHRYGFGDFWKAKIGDKAHIEAVGACTTLIWEEFKKRGFAEKISKNSANLLLIGIISNTLDFGAQVTDKRDVKAAKELGAISDLPKDWKETYFKEQEVAASQDPIWAIVSDTKVLDIPNLGFPIAMGQLELWNGNSFIDSHIEDIRRALVTFGVKDWFLSVPSISEKKNYFYTESDIVKKLLEKAVQAKFKENKGSTGKLWLRKEVRKKLLEMHGN